MKFTFEDESGLVPGTTPQLARKAITFLDTYKIGNLISTRKLMSLVGISERQKDRLTPMSAMSPYKVLIGGKYFWGNPETVQAYLKQNHERRNKHQ